MRKHSSVRSTFPSDPVEVRRFKAINGLGDTLFESVRPDLHVWRFGSTEYVSEREALAEIGRRATVHGPYSSRGRPAA